MIQQMQKPGIGVAEAWGPFSVTGLNTIGTGGAMGIGRGIATRLPR